MWTDNFSSAMKVFYTALYLLMQRIKKDLQRRGAKGIGIIFRVLQFKQIGCETPLHHI